MRAQVFQAAKLLCCSSDVNWQGRAIHTRLANIDALYVNNAYVAQSADQAAGQRGPTNQPRVWPRHVPRFRSGHTAPLGEVQLSELSGGDGRAGCTSRLIFWSRVSSAISKS